MRRPLLPLLPIILLPSLALASISRGSIDGKYELHTGILPFCPLTFEIRSTPEILRASDLRANGTDCSGGEIPLTEELPLSEEKPDGPTFGNSLIKFFREKSNIGEFISGFVEGAIECGKFNTARSVGYIVVIGPEEDFITTWQKLYGGTGSLAQKVQTKARFQDEYQYLFLGDKCVYRAAKEERACFPGSARVKTREGWNKMEQLRTGDEVHVGGERFSEVFAWTHRDANAKGRYVEIWAGESRLVVTEGHYVYTGERVLQASELRVGMYMKNGEGREIRIERIQRVEESGLYNPQTVDGDIVVNDFWVTTYTSAVKRETGHAALSPIRAAWGVWRLLGGKAWS